MFSYYSTEKLLGLEDVIIKNIEETPKEISITPEMPVRSTKCPCCGKETKSIHDYRTQPVHDLPAFGKQVVLQMRKRRYRCNCGKRFYEPNAHIAKYHRMTKRLFASVIEQLRTERSFTSVARETGFSVSTIIRWFDVISYSAPNLPTVLAIDEFKGNTSGEKYQVILTDPVNKQVLDILPNRFAHSLTSYFRSIDRQNANESLDTKCAEQ